MNLGGQAPTTQDVDRVEDPALQIKQVLAHWYNERSALEGAIAEKRSTSYFGKRAAPEDAPVAERKHKPPGSDSLADALAKCMDRTTMTKHLTACSSRISTGEQPHFRISLSLLKAVTR